MQPNQVEAAKMVITAVAGRIFAPEQTTEEFAAILEDEHELQDVEEYQLVHDGQKGLFLVVLDDDRVVGTGAIRPLFDQTAELKRIWLLEKYHGRGIGYRMAMQLFDFARQAGYNSVYLQTSTHSQRAINFYKRLGFVEIPAFYEDPDEEDICMGIMLEG